MENITSLKDPGYAKLKKLITTRQEIERDMAKNLLVALDKNGEVLNILRKHIQKGAKQIKQLCDLKGGKFVFQRAFSDAKNYKWEGEHAKALGSWFDFKEFLSNEQNLANFNVSQCSDIIRFYGEITEAAADLPRILSDRIKGAVDRGIRIPQEYVDFVDETHKLQKLGEILNKQRKSYQRPAGIVANEWGIDYQSNRDGSIWVKNLKDGRRLRVSSSRERVVSNKGLYPTRDENGQWALETSAAYEERQDLIDQYYHELTKIEHALVSEKAGISRWVQLDGDLVNRMNRVFGLAHGATISGTTTDTLYFLDRVTAANEYLDKMLPLSQRFSSSIAPILYMLPLATIVGNAHHTTIEVALPLNLNLKDRFQYIIGRYKTLKPEGVKVRCDEIDRALDEAQTNAAGKLVLVYYKKGSKEYDGYVIFGSDAEDMAVWDSIARGDTNLISLFQGFQAYPTIYDIAKMHPIISKALLSGPQDPIFGKRFDQRRARFEQTQG